MRILVVEDEEAIAGFIVQGLTEAGYAVDLAADAAADDGDALEYESRIFSEPEAEAADLPGTVEHEHRPDQDDDPRPDGR